VLSCSGPTAAVRGEKHDVYPAAAARQAACLSAGSNAVDLMPLGRSRAPPMSPGASGKGTAVNLGTYGSR
jgi:hypothetical protein